MVIYMLIFRTIIPEALLKLLTIMENIIKGQDLFTGYQKYGMARNLILTLEQKTRERGPETNANYKLVIEDVSSTSSHRKCSITRRYTFKGGL